ncbi:MAG: protein kinase, partial [Bacteroidota bacterium]
MVALKFLPDRVRMDEAAKARFRQEAQAAAGLNHNNICTIFGVEDVDGSLFMVMEYVEGGTLRERLPFPKIDEAISIASQIGEALQEAHSKDIVHRDVKADNIMLTAKGQAKVMDFGLAKLKGSLKLTRTSSTVGTMGYMAPEQIQGGEVDDRSDIFSFGVLLFEILTGKLPFRGEHEAAMVYSIVNEEPQDISQMLPDLSPIVVNCIQRCLEKDPKDRYQHFDDIVADLRRSQKKTSRVMRSSAHMTSIPSTQPISSADIASGPASGTTSVKRRAGVIGGALGGVAAIAFVVWFFSGPSLPRVNPNMEVSVMQIPATEYYYPGISPDGKWLTFPGADLNGKWDIYMMLIETGESKRVTFDSSATLAGASTARFSPDGTLITYGRRDPKTNLASVCVVSVLSGQVRVVADTGVSPRWSPVDGRIYYFRALGRAYPGRSAFREYWSVSPKGGDSRLEFADSTVTGQSSFFSLGMSPTGRKLVFTRPTGNQINEIFVRDLETGEETQLTHDKRIIDEVVWADNGYIFFTSNRSGNFNIWAMPEEGGDAVQITRGAGPDNGLTYSEAANRMVFSQRTLLSTAWIVNTDGTGNRQLFPEDNLLESHISPDGKRLVLRVSHSTLLPTL